MLYWVYVSRSGGWSPTSPRNLEQGHAVGRKELDTFWKTTSHLLLSSGRDGVLGHRVPDNHAARNAQHKFGPIRPTKWWRQVGPAALHHKMERVYLGSKARQIRGHKQAACTSSSDPLTNHFANHFAIPSAQAHSHLENHVWSADHHTLRMGWPSRWCKLETDGSCFTLTWKNSFNASECLYQDQKIIWPKEIKDQQHLTSAEMIYFSVDWYPGYYYCHRCSLSSRW